MTIETPIRPPSGGPPSAPPPDPGTRVIFPPPDADSRYDHACADCGLPIHEDQAACLSCGAMVEQPDGGAGVRRAALGSVTALLVLGGAVGAAVAGLPHGKRVPKAQTAQVFGQKSIPPATAGTNGATAVKPVTPLPGTTTGKSPPPIAPVAPHKAKTPKANRKPASGKAGKSSSTGSNAGSGSNSNNNSNNNSGNNNNGGGNKHHKPPPPSLTLFTTGEAPADAASFGSSGSGAPTNTIDSDIDTAWSSTASGQGISVQPNGGSHRFVGVVSKTGLQSATVYSTNAASPPTDIGGWKQESGVGGDAKKHKFPVGNHTATYYLVVVDAPGVSINEIQLLP